MNVEFTRVFDDHFAKLSPDIQKKSRKAIEVFINSYTTKQFPKGLRMHKCGPFTSLSVSMNHRIFVLPIKNGVKFAFIGNHQHADRYLKNKE